MNRLRAAVESQWYGRPHWLLLLSPLVLLFIVISALRRKILSASARPLSVPVVVVGNISVGGTGKTPVIIALVKALTAAGYKPGVISRGYGVSIESSQLLPVDAAPSEFGDEPVLVARGAGCPVAVGRNRVDSVELLIRRCGCDLVLSDDGLQHYRLHRDVEIAVIDGDRQLGNGWRLPVGPLREGAQRLQRVDFVLVNGDQTCPQAPSAHTYHFQLRPQTWRNLLTDQRLPLGKLTFPSNAVAVAGIGNPDRFFNSLAALGFCGQQRSFPDHHAYSALDFAGMEASTVLMTEKDAVKCHAFAGPDWWALSVDAQLPEDFLRRLQQSLKRLPQPLKPSP